MAEGTSGKQDDVVCRFFLSTSCRDGDKCLFSHDRARRIPDSVCRFYLQGTCMYGKNCRYDHIRPKNNKKFNLQPHIEERFAARCSQNSQLDFTDTNTRSQFRERSYQPNFTSLTNERSNVTTSDSRLANWINAPEFVPKSIRSYADTVKSNIVEPVNIPSMDLCPFFMVGVCPFEDQCPYVHGIVCVLCNKACLHPFDEQQQKAHTEECEKELEKDMELSFAIQDSVDKTCGICMDVVLNKEPLAERRFGILEKCNHVFCLSCIRKWRRLNQPESDQSVDLAPTVTRACPECRTASGFVIPSGYFVDSEEEKKKLITEYKKALNQKRCKYFKQGRGMCPFGGACFYLHDKPDGTKVDLPPPRRRRRQNQDGELDYLDQISLWDFFVNRERDSHVLIGLFQSDSDDEDDDLDNSLIRDLLNRITF